MIPFLGHVPVEPDTLIAGHVQAVGKDGVASHTGPERLVVAVETIGTAQQRIFLGKAVLCKDNVCSQIFPRRSAFQFLEDPFQFTIFHYLSLLRRRTRLGLSPLQ